MCVCVMCVYLCYCLLDFLLFVLLPSGLPLICATACWTSSDLYVCVCVCVCVCVSNVPSRLALGWPETLRFKRLRVKAKRWVGGMMHDPATLGQQERRALEEWNDLDMQLLSFGKVGPPLGRRGLGGGR